MSTKEFHLHSKTVSKGRESIAELITAFLPSSPQGFPPSAPGLLNIYLSCCESYAASWKRHAADGYLHNASVFDEAVAASSNATVAAEIACELKWISRLCYDPEENEKSVITPEMRKFARDVNRLLNVMHELSSALRDARMRDEGIYPADQLQFERRQRLQQALYLSELGVKITCPKNYVYHHPEASKCLKQRASIRRALGDELSEAARADETLAGLYRGKTRY